MVVGSDFRMGNVNEGRSKMCVVNGSEEDPRDMIARRLELMRRPGEGTVVCCNRQSYFSVAHYHCRRASVLTNADLVKTSSNSEAFLGSPGVAEVTSPVHQYVIFVPWISTVSHSLSSNKSRCPISVAARRSKSCLTPEPVSSRSLSSLPARRGINFSAS